MDKLKFVIIIVIMIAIFSFVIFMNYDRINYYISNKEWELVDSIAKIYLEKYIQLGSAGDKLIIVNSDKISGYTNSSDAQYDIDINLKDAVIDSKQNFCVVGENGGSKILLINEKGKAWESTVNGEILKVSVNRNGYVACVYSKSGYKSIIKVINPSGEELFTNYLASSYAIDAEISNDNKYLAIAEVNTDGINVESNIKIVDINNMREKENENIKLDENVLVLDIIYTDKNDILVLEDSKIEKISSSGGYEKKLIKEYNHSDASLVSIENGNNAIIVEKQDTGIFSTDYMIRIYSSEEDYKEYKIDTPVDLIRAQGKTICANMGNQLLFLNTNGKLTKRCRVDGKVRDVKLYDNGSMAAIAFKDRIEIIKL